jgi:hypothetical protein
MLIYIVTWNANCNLHGFGAGLLSSHNTEKRLLPIHGHLEHHSLLQKEFQLEKKKKKKIESYCD